MPATPDASTASDASVRSHASGAPGADRAAPAGLTAQQVAERVAGGKVNTTDDRSSRSIGQILRANTFTLFNLILAIALVLVLATGRWPDAAFGFVMIINLAIGVFTEVRAKRTLDRLSILSAPHAVVLRDGAQRQVALGEVVLDDVVRVTTGDQVPADGELLEVTGLEVDESLLTGESRPVHKGVGDEVLSGSAIVAGTGTYRVNRVGADGYANKLTAAAKKFSVAHSELRAGINTILKIVSVLIVPIAALLFWSQLRASGGWATIWDDDHWKEAVVAAVAGVVGMIPDGLVLLTSLNFALAAMLLARQQVLVQELPAVEILARVDVLCLDKTGTLTDGHISLTALDDVAEPVAGSREALAALAVADGGNATSEALAAGLADVVPARTTGSVPFSSARKWSAVRTDDGVWVLGAPEVLLAGREDEVATAALATVREHAATGARVVLLARAAAGDAPGGDTPGNGTTGSGTAGSGTTRGALPGTDEPLPTDLVPALVAVLGERVRPDAAQTLAYFREQGVRAIVISGDNPTTVGAIASGLDLRGEGQAIEGYDARRLPAGADDLADVLETEQVFGRVVPEQKHAIVKALQSRGHVVAMTGDGVNDSLALKDADLGIAMGNGAPASKAVARLVLLDGRFSTLPGVLGQGRRVMANMERVATLFLTKTTYSFFLALSVVILGWDYPFLPRHLTLASSLTIGIPAFFLALPPNNRRYLAGFLRRVLWFAIPIGAVLGVAILTTFSWLRGDGTDVARTATTAVLIGAGLWVVGILARPPQAWKVAMIAALAAAGVGAYLVPFVRRFFELEVLGGKDWLGAAVVVVITWLLVEVVHLVVDRRRAPR